MPKATFQKTFAHVEGDSFSAYNAAVRWIKERGYSVGSMQSGAPTMIFKGDCYVAKHRKLRADDLNQAAGHIVGEGGRFCDGAVTITLYGHDAVQAVEAELQRDDRVLVTGKMTV